MTHSGGNENRPRTLRVVLSVAAGALACALLTAHLLALGRAVADVKTLAVSGPNALGRGLQDVYRLYLSEPAPLPSGLVVTLTTDGTKCLVAPSENTVGVATLTRTVPAGKRRASFVIQSQPVGSGTDSCSVSATASGWTPDSDPFTVSIGPTSYFTPLAAMAAIALSTTG